MYVANFLMIKDMAINRVEKRLSDFIIVVMLDKLRVFLLGNFPVIPIFHTAAGDGVGRLRNDSALLFPEN